jgi:CRP-like cAMP-binding protein
MASPLLRIENTAPQKSASVRQLITPLRIAQSPYENHLLAGLPPEQLKALSKHLELVLLPVGTMLYQPGVQLSHAYFPTTSIISLHYLTELGESAESASIGNEGVLGVSLFMGGQGSTGSAVVQTAGYAYRLDRHKLIQEFEHGATLQKLLLRYTQALMTQMSQTAVCNRHHVVEQQLCRWLLLTIDRLAASESTARIQGAQPPPPELIITQELIANMLGVRREGITEAAGRLQAAGVIRYRRGHITIISRAGLEHRACECYCVVKKEISSLLSDFVTLSGRSSAGLGVPLTLIGNRA